MKRAVLIVLDSVGAGALTLSCFGFAKAVLPRRGRRVYIRRKRIRCALHSLITCFPLRGKVGRAKPGSDEGRPRRQRQGLTLRY